MIPEAMRPGLYIHATALLVGSFGVLIIGPSGSGKSTLAGALIAAADGRGWPSCLVGDDRIEIAVDAGAVVARVHPAIAGLLEVRGVGIVRCPYQPACAIKLVVDLQSAAHAGLRSSPRLGVPDQLGAMETLSLKRRAVVTNCHAVLKKLTWLHRNAES